MKVPLGRPKSQATDQVAYANCVINQLIELQVWPNNTAAFEQTKRC